MALTRLEDRLVVSMTTKGLERYIRRLKEVSERDDGLWDREWLTERKEAAESALGTRRKMDESDYSPDENFWGEASDRDDLSNQQGGE